jgi:hypothetical protein
MDCWSKYTELPHLVHDFPVEVLMPVGQQDPWKQLLLKQLRDSVTSSMISLWKVSCLLASRTLGSSFS